MKDSKGRGRISPRVAGRRSVGTGIISGYFRFEESFPIYIFWLRFNATEGKKSFFEFIFRGDAFDNILTAFKRVAQFVK